MDQQLAYLGVALDTEEFADVTLCCQTRRLRAHRILLSASSPYLQKLLLNHPVHDPITIILDSVHHEDMAAILVFIYTGKVSVSKQRFGSFLDAAELLDIEILNPVKGKVAKLSLDQRPQAVDADTEMTTLPMTEDEEYKYKLMKLEQEATSYLKNCANLPKEYLMKSIEKARAFVEEKMSNFEKEAKLKFEDLERKHNEYRKSRKSTGSVRNSVDEGVECDVNVTEILNNLPGMSISKVHLDEMTATKRQRKLSSGASTSKPEKPRGMARVKPLPLLMPITSGSAAQKPVAPGGQRIGLIVRPNNGSCDAEERVRVVERVPEVERQVQGGGHHHVTPEHLRVYDQPNPSNARAFPFEIVSRDGREMQRQLFTNGLMDLTTCNEGETGSRKLVQRGLDVRENFNNGINVSEGHRVRLSGDVVNDLSIRSQGHGFNRHDHLLVGGKRARTPVDDDDIQILEPQVRNGGNGTPEVHNPAKRRADEEMIANQNNDIYERILRYRKEIRKQVPSGYTYVGEVRDNRTRFGDAVDIGDVHHVESGRNMTSGNSLVAGNGTKIVLSQGQGSSLPQILDYGKKHSLTQMVGHVQLRGPPQGHVDEVTLDKNVRASRLKPVASVANYPGKASTERVVINEKPSTFGDKPQAILHASFVQNMNRALLVETPYKSPMKSPNTSPAQCKSPEETNPSQTLQPSWERVNILNRILEQAKNLSTNYSTPSINSNNTSRSLAPSEEFPKPLVTTPKPPGKPNQHGTVANPSANHAVQTQNKNLPETSVAKSHFPVVESEVRLNGCSPNGVVPTNHNSPSPPPKSDDSLSEPASLPDAKKSAAAHTCPDCGKVFTRRQLLVQHERIHTGDKPYRCVECGKDFTQRGHWSTHRKQLPASKSVELACQHCDKTFITRASLKVHQRSHAGAKPYVCPVPDCKKDFSQLRNFKYHMSIHAGTKEFSTTCPECGKYFNDRGYLSSHMKIHLNRKEYQCQFCDKRFNQRVAYNMHVRIHTGIKPHACTHCTKSFSRKMLLKQHLRIHTGERPFTCNICNKAFADRSNMSLHMRLHSGIKPYTCAVCEKSFTKKHHLKTHMNYHMGVKPYTCDKCGLTFSQSSNMRTHHKRCVIPPGGATST